ncbi:MAG: redoxin domain-containing protein, partial [Nitrospinaceae bacterium]|nr:redoxin domain-containing protein [Nitrospinaceae bacterium]
MKPLLHAPKLNAAHLPWFNTRTPLDLSDFKGKLTILDFWTYCCINCIHVIPTLKRIEENFSDSVVVVGIHSPKFPGEKNTRNLEQAIHRYEIAHPVVQDINFSIWKNYAIRAWPTLILVGPNGYILGEYPGEPDPEMLLNTIDGILKDLKSKNALFGNAKDLLFIDKYVDEKTLSFPGKISYSLEDKEFAIADSNHNQIVTADSEGRITRRNGSGKIGKREGAFNEAEFFRPQGLCFQEGLIWVADTENHLLRRIDVKDETVTTCAGTGKQGA